MPDPVERPAPLPTREARARLGVPVEGRCIGCAGAIDSRKGADLLIAAFERSAPAEHDRLLLIGPHAPDIRALLSGTYAGAVRSGRIVSVDRFLPPENLASSLMALDVVCTPYPNHIGSASIVLRAAAAGRPVLGSDFGWVGRTVEQFRLGWTCAVNNQERFADTIRESLRQAMDWKPGPYAERLVRFHSPENFAKAWCVCLRRRLGLPAEAGALTWDWVLGGAEGKGHQGRAEGV